MPQRGSCTRCFSRTMLLLLVGALGPAWPALRVVAVQEFTEVAGEGTRDSRLRQTGPSIANDTSSDPTQSGIARIVTTDGARGGVNAIDLSTANFVGKQGRVHPVANKTGVGTAGEVGGIIAIIGEWRGTPVATDAFRNISAVEVLLSNDSRDSGDDRGGNGRRRDTSKNESASPTELSVKDGISPGQRSVFLNERGGGNKISNVGSGPASARDLRVGQTTNRPSIDGPSLLGLASRVSTGAGQRSVDGSTSPNQSSAVVNASSGSVAVLTMGGNDTNGTPRSNSSAVAEYVMPSLRAAAVAEPVRQAGSEWVLARTPQPEGSLLLTAGGSVQFHASQKKSQGKGGASQRQATEAYRGIASTTRADVVSQAKKAEKDPMASFQSHDFLSNLHLPTKVELPVLGQMSVPPMEVASHEGLSSSTAKPKAEGPRDRKLSRLSQSHLLVVVSLCIVACVFFLADLYLGDRWRDRGHVASLWTPSQ